MFAICPILQFQRPILQVLLIFQAFCCKIKLQKKKEAKPEFFKKTPSFFPKKTKNFLTDKE